MTPVRVAAVIPARMASSRFPGKPLLRLHGLPMVEHVRRRALLCRRFTEVVVATCDPEIAEVVRGYGGQCLMTSPGHPGATDRVAEAVRHLSCTHVVNVQGDEILILPEDLARFVGAIEAAPEVPAWNAVARIQQMRELSDRSVVKCAVSGTGRILWCAREFSSAGRDAPAACEPLRVVLGVLGYRREVLARYTAWPRTPWEVAESLDQSRFVEQGVALQSVEFAKGYVGINEPREVEAVSDTLRQDAGQQTVLQEVLAS